MTNHNFKPLALETETTTITEAISILQELTLALLDNLLTPKAKTSSPPPLLSTLLTPQKARTLTELHLWKTKGPQVKFSNKKTNKGLNKYRQKNPFSLKELITKAIKTKIEPRQWQLTFQQRLLHALNGGTKGNGLPDLMIPVMEKAAFQNLHFKKEVATKIRYYLKDYVLFNPDETCIPNLSPCALWALIGLTDTGYDKKQRIYSAMIKEIRDQARVMAMIENEAGFWDLWLMQIVAKNWPHTIEDKKDQFSRSIAALPLMPKKRSPDSRNREEKSKENGEGETKEKPSFWQRFKKRFKNFFAFIFRKSRSDGSTATGDKKGQIIEWARTDWEQQIPAFLKNSIFINKKKLF